MELNKSYFTKIGGEYIPLFFNENEKLVFVRCIRKSGIITEKWFWSCHRIFKNE
jgi:hypothetical protein